MANNCQKDLFLSAKFISHPRVQSNMPAKKTAQKTVKKIANIAKTVPKKDSVKKTAVKKTAKTTKMTKTAKNVTKGAVKNATKTPKKTTIIPEDTAIMPIELPPAKQEPDEAKDKKPKEKARAIFAAEQVICEPSDAARDLYAQSRFGATLEEGKIQMSLIEALYLLEKEKLTVADLRGRLYDFSSFIKKAKRIEPNFWVRYCVFKDMRNRGYVVKTALKFGADFRVYDRGIKPGEDHARWVLYPIHEGTTLTWYEFAAKARVAHSTKKRLLIGIVDDEGDVTYYEIKWMRP